MIRTADEEWVYNLARPFYLLVNQSYAEPYNKYSIIRSAAAAIVSFLAYCVVGEEELESVSRATIIPSTTYQRIVKRQMDINIINVLRAMDFPDPIIIRTKNFVALGLVTNKDIYIGVRGTVGLYDWITNLSCWPRTSEKLHLPVKFHGGFLSEAELLFEKLTEEINTKKLTQSAIFYCGHSLGGAIASIINQARLVIPRDLMLNGDGYTFGAPRTTWKFASEFIAQPFAIRRSADIIPRVPPSLIGYESFRDQRHPDGKKFVDRGSVDLVPFVEWLNALAFSRFIDGHAVEHYRRESLQAAAHHPKISNYIQYDEIE